MFWFADCQTAEDGVSGETEEVGVYLAEKTW